MLARHRQSLILQAVRSDGSARVSDLTQRLGVSDMTIRRDLEVLARDGLIEKVHGGAVLPGTPASHEPGFDAKLVLERPEKNAIATTMIRLSPPRRCPNQRSSSSISRDDMPLTSITRPASTKNGTDSSTK